MSITEFLLCSVPFLRSDTARPRLTPCPTASTIDHKPPGPRKVPLRYPLLVSIARLTRIPSLSGDSARFLWRWTAISTCALLPLFLVTACGGGGDDPPPVPKET